MVQIIEKQQDAEGAECIKFRVYRSQNPNTPDLILGEWQHATEEPNPGNPKGALGIANSQLGTPVGIEYEHVKTHADKHGVPFVWVDDPQGLFPSSQRLSF
jgi:hypothetical protein